jgi:putative nucleotidyltransferase with HDIG domain
MPVNLVSLPVTFLRRINRRLVYLAFLLILSTGIVFLALFIPFSASLSKDRLQVGSVATQDILAPHDLSYFSAILTVAQRQQAAANVAPVYSQADTNVARRQLEHLRAALSFMTSVRSDGYASQQQKLADLTALESITLTQDTALSILNLPASSWQAVQQEAVVVLEQVMRNTIREDQLDEIRRGVPALISLSLPEDQANLVTGLVTGFVAPNSLYDASQTEAARQAAQDAIQPVTRSFVTGERIVPRGEVITPTDLEALSQFGLAQPQYTWQDLVSASALVIVAMAFLVFYLRRNPSLTSGPQAPGALTLITLLFTVSLLTARVIGPGHTLIPYFFPFAAYSLLVAALLGAEPALISSLPLAFLITYGLPNALELTLYYILGSFFGVLTLGRGRRIINFFWAGLVVACSGTAVIVAYRLSQATTDWIGLATLIIIAFANGVASASITLILQFFLAQLLGMTTALQLMELSRPDHPLLQLLLRTAPGTYQHSLQVANLAEQAAERIGADALLARVGALYHDAGKAVNSVFFIENQIPGNLDPHDDLDPMVSAAMIISHVPEGLNLARKYHLPRRIQDFIAEHHGTMLARYQYNQAVEAFGTDESRVDREKFRYPGPRPQSRETALLMLADGCEARVRSERPKDEAELRAVIKSTIDNRVATGALNDTGLTLHDLEVIEDSFTTTLRGIYHPRIQYPSLESLPKTTEETIEVEQIIHSLAAGDPNPDLPVDEPSLNDQHSQTQDTEQPHPCNVPTRPAPTSQSTINPDSNGVASEP